MKSDNKPVEGRAFSRPGAVALLACAVIMPMTATASVPAETPGQAQDQIADAAVAAVEGQAAAKVAAPPAVQAEIAPAEPARDEVTLEEVEGPPTEERVFQAICAAGIQHPEIVMRQALHETGNLRHPFLMGRNNLFGFRTRAYLRFDKWQDSVAYYKRWQDRRYTNSSENYFRFLDRIRYASPGYQAHVMRFRWERSCPD